MRTFIASSSRPQQPRDGVARSNGLLSASLDRLRSSFRRRLSQRRRSVAMPAEADDGEGPRDPDHPLITVCRAQEAAETSIDMELGSSEEEDDEEEEEVEPEETSSILGDSASSSPAAGAGGDGASFYPIFLPIDKNFESKYLFHYRHLKKRGKSVQERVYVFLEHPVGWGCFVYHMSV